MSEANSWLYTTRHNSLQARLKAAFYPEESEAVVWAAARSAKNIGWDGSRARGAGTAVWAAGILLCYNFLSSVTVRTASGCAQGVSNNHV